MSAAAVCTGRSVAKAFGVALEEARVATIGQALPDALSFTGALDCAEGLRDARSDTIADPEAVRDTKASPDTKAVSCTQAFSTAQA